ncbi:MAG: DUF4173 domain-containing protein [Acidobacteriota bacterium]|nr:DUF4173 domain-containing protein [Acidobacteriota bacterium]
MNERTKTGLEIIEAAVLLGILGDAFLRATPWGLNVFLFIGALVATMSALVLRRRKDLWSFQTASLHGALIFFAAMFVWRDAIQLKLLNTLAIFTILVVLTLPALKIKTQIAGLIQYIYAACAAGLNAAFGPFYLLMEDVEWKTIPRAGWTKHLIAVFRGLAIAAPILFVFGALFVAADAVFQGIVERTFQINADVLFSHFLLAGFVAWCSAGYLRGSLMGFSYDDYDDDKEKTQNEIKTQALSVTAEKTDDASQPAAPKEEEAKKEEAKKPQRQEDWNWRDLNNSVLPESLTLGAIETGIVLGLINLLFLSFVVVQIPYLFGGMDLVQSTPDFKLAEYARRGFGELVAVAALVLPILLLTHWLLRKDKPVNEKIYRVLAGIQIVLLFVIMISATQRLLLYAGNLGYGLTEARFYPMAFMIWLALVFIWFGLTVLRGAREQFAWGALWLALFIVGTLHVFNPDEFIVRTNVRLMQQGRSFDSQYVANLSDDAVPALLETMPSMKFEQQCAVKHKLARRFEQAHNENDFRTWNVSRWLARREMAQYGERLDAAGCPPAPQSYENDF